MNKPLNEAEILSLHGCPAWCESDLGTSGWVLVERRKLGIYLRNAFGGGWYYDGTECLYRDRPKTI